jgi:hypothetical protein
VICKAYFKTHIEPTYFGIFHVWFNFANLRRLRSQYYTTHFIAHIYIRIYIRYQISHMYIYRERERNIYSDQKVLRIVFGKHTKHHKSGTHTDTHTSIHVHASPYMYTSKFTRFKPCRGPFPAQARHMARRWRPPMATCSTNGWGRW